MQTLDELYETLYECPAHRKDMAEVVESASVLGESREAMREEALGKQKRRERHIHHLSDQLEQMERRRKHKKWVAAFGIMVGVLAVISGIGYRQMAADHGKETASDRFGRTDETSGRSGGTIGSSTSRCGNGFDRTDTNCHRAGTDEKAKGNKAPGTDEKAKGNKAPGTDEKAKGDKDTGGSSDTEADQSTEKNKKTNKNTYGW